MNGSFVVLFIDCMHNYVDYVSDVDEKEMGSPEKYPDHTFEVAHSRRRAYFITAENEEDKKAWVETFKVCCRKASGN